MTILKIIILQNSRILEMKTEQLNVLGLMDPFVGKYFSIDYIRQEVLGMTEKQIEEMDMQMTDDIEMGRAINPTDLVAADQQQLDAETDNIELDKEVKKAQIASQKSKTAADQQKEAKLQPASAKPGCSINKLQTTLHYGNTRTRNR